MTVRTGDAVSKTTDDHCEKCGMRMHLTEGKQVPSRTCGSDMFTDREGRLRGGGSGGTRG